MKKIFYLLLSVLFLASCSTPKYTYYFDHYDYNSGKKSVAVKTESKVNTEVSPLVIVDDEAMASTKEVIVTKEIRAEEKVETKKVVSKEELVAKFKSMSKEEKKQFKKEVKSEVKKMKKDDGVKGTKALGHDLRYAAIFGAIGIVLLIIGGDVLGVLGAISLIVGLFFFIRWLVNQ